MSRNIELDGLKIKEDKIMITYNMIDGLELRSFEKDKISDRVVRSIADAIVDRFMLSEDYNKLIKSIDLQELKNLVMLQVAGKTLNQGRY